MGVQKSLPMMNIPGVVFSPAPSCVKEPSIVGAALAQISASATIWDTGGYIGDIRVEAALEEDLRNEEGLCSYVEDIYSNWCEIVLILFQVIHLSALDQVCIQVSL